MREINFSISPGFDKALELFLTPDKDAQKALEKIIYTPDDCWRIKICTQDQAPDTEEEKN